MTKGNEKKQGNVLAAFLIDPLSEEYRVQRRTLLYVSLFFVLMVLADGVLSSPFGSVAVRPTTVIAAKILSWFAVAFLVFSLWQVVNDSFRRWAETWRAEESLFLASILQQNEWLAEQYRTQATNIERAKKQDELERVRRALSEVRESRRSRIASQSERGSPSNEQADVSDLQQIDALEAQMRTSRSELDELSYGETSSSAREHAFAKVVAEYGQVASGGDVSLEQVEAFRQLEPYARFRKLRDDFAASFFKGRLEPVAVTITALGATLFFSLFLSVNEPGASSADKMLSELQLWRRTLSLQAGEDRFVWLPSGTNVFTMSFPVFAREERDISKDSERGKAIAATVTHFLSALSECHNSEAPVEVRFVGYADGKISNDFTLEANVELANDRAAALFALAPTDLPFSGSAKQWPKDRAGHAEMRRAVGLSDVSEISGGLGRRVDLEVLHAGTCDRDRLIEFYTSDRTWRAGA